METILKIVFRQIDPCIEILLFDQTISSGYGALSTAIFYPFTSKSLRGIHGVQMHCKSFWQMFGLYLKIYFDYCLENITIAKEAVFSRAGKGLGLNYAYFPSSSSLPNYSRF